MVPQAPPSYNQTLANDLRELMEEPLEDAVQAQADQSVAAHASSDKKFPTDILADIEVLAKDGEDINKRFLRFQDVLSHSKLESASSSFDNLYKVYEDLFLTSKKISGKATGDAVDFSSTICSFVLRPAVPLQQKLTEIGQLIENYQGKAQDAGDQRKKFFVLCDELDAFAQELAKEVEDDGIYKPKPEAVSILRNIEKKQEEIEKINGMILDPLQTYLGIAKGAAKALFSACPKAADTTLAKVSDVVDKFSPKVGDIKAQMDLRDKLHQEIIKLKAEIGIMERAQQLRKTYVAFPSMVKNLSGDLRAYAKRLGPFTDVYQQLVAELESWVYEFDRGQDPTQTMFFKARVGANVAIAAHAAKAFEIFATAV